MIIFWITYILHRALSGVRNGMIYDGGNRARNAVFIPTIGLWITPLIAIMQAYMSQPWQFLLPQARLLWSILVGYIALGVVSYMAISRLRGRHRYPAARLHTWTFFEQVFASALWFLFGWEATLAAILAVYPALVIQKAIINRFSLLPWNDERTDDPTGKTYALPLWGITIAVPRIRHRWRMAFAIISTVVFCCTYIIRDYLANMLGGF